ncbi:MAG: GEVED domain-containing protein [Smithellaceae bacterium]
MKRILASTIMMMIVVFAGTALAATYDYSDATGYGLASHTNPSWQRLGTSWTTENQPTGVWEDGSDDGVFWSINGGAFGHDEMTVGDEVTFKFVMYKQKWGIHSYDTLKVWIDWGNNANFSDNGDLFLTEMWYFRNDYPNAYNDDSLSGTTAGVSKEFTKTILLTVDPGEYWLRARVVCNADINSNPDSFKPTGNYWQGEVEDWKFKVNPVPEPMSLILFGLGLLGLAGVRRKFKK